MKLRDRIYNCDDELLAEIDSSGFPSFTHNGRHPEEGCERLLRVNYRIVRNNLAVLEEIMVEFRIRDI